MRGKTFFFKYEIDKLDIGTYLKWIVYHCEEYTMFRCYVPLNFYYSKMQDILLKYGSCRCRVPCSGLRSRGKKRTLVVWYRVGITVM